ncbi:MAG: cation/multidrug efflux pump [Cellvibrionaceae bacterium]
MGYLFLAIVFVLLAAVLAYWASKVLLKTSWFIGWLRGMFGLALTLGVVVLTLMALDIYSYKQLDSEQNIATISFTNIAPQEFSASFVDAEGIQQNFTLLGDQWQLDSRVIKWKGFISRVGMKTGYRLDRISGRYLLLDDERTKERSVFGLSDSTAGVDVWNWLKDMDNNALVDARYGNSTFLPMVDGGQYQISVSTSGLLARPLNEPAQAAVDQWR